MLFGLTVGRITLLIIAIIITLLLFDCSYDCLYYLC